MPRKRSLKGTQMLGVPTRFYRIYLESKPYGCNEKDFHYVEQKLVIPVSQACLVLVDCWSKHYCRSWTNRATGIIRDRIVPVVEAARGAGLRIVHAPSQNIAQKYPQSQAFFQPGDEEVGPRYANVDPEWPPKEFVQRSGGYEAFRRESHPRAQVWLDEYKDQMISGLVAPRPEDYVVRSGSQLHRILKHLKVLHLFYAGFATNMCLHHRDYGMRAFSERGYNTILIRDCTTAVETHDTVDELLTTKVSVQELEMQRAFSMTSADFIIACRGVSKADRAHC